MTIGGNMLGSMSDVTRILSQIEQGDPQAAEQLLPLVYDELRKLAAAKLVQEKPGQTLQATALVHEAYLRLAGPVCRTCPEPPDSRPLAPSPQPLGPPAWHSRGHFFAAAAEAMRRILVENARQKASLKRGGPLQRLELNEVVATEAGDAIELLTLDEALEKLCQADPQAAEVVKLRYFAGLTMDETALALGISPRTAYYAWQYARSWLKQELQDGQPRA
jgi:RNA polymerase sigma factor (sigma-70 family)